MLSQRYSLYIGNSYFGGDMDIRALFMGIMVLFSTQALALDIYKCIVDGRVEFSEKPCGPNSTAVQLKELAAPLASHDMEKTANLDYTIKSHLIREQIARHQHKIKRYRQRMQAEIKNLQKQQPSTKKKVIRANYNNNTPIVKVEDTSKTTSGKIASKKPTSPGKLKGAQSKNNGPAKKNTPLIDGSVKVSTKDHTDAFNNIANALSELNTDKLSDQINAVTQRYSTLIKAEEFQINLLREDLRELRE